MPRKGCPFSRGSLLILNTLLLRRGSIVSSMSNQKIIPQHCILVPISPRFCAEYGTLHLLLRRVIRITQCTQGQGTIHIVEVQIEDLVAREAGIRQEIVSLPEGAEAIAQVLPITTEVGRVLRRVMEVQQAHKEQDEGSYRSRCSEINCVSRLR